METLGGEPKADGASSLKYLTVVLDCCTAAAGSDSGLRLDEPFY